MPTLAIQPDECRDDLLSLAFEVTAALPCAFRQGNARDAARALAGTASWVSNRTSVTRMQQCMAALVRHEDAWRPGKSFRTLPTLGNGFVDEWVAMIAVVVSSLEPAFGSVNLRAGMAWWATERDAAAWQELITA